MTQNATAMAKLTDFQNSISNEGGEAIIAENDGLEIITGSTHILLVAPHKEDDNTGDLVREAASKLGCSAIINKTIERNEQDMNRINAATTHNSFIPSIDRVLKEEGPTKVFFIHGISDEGLQAEQAEMEIEGDLDCLIGYGQGQEARLTADEGSVDALISSLADNDFKARSTRVEAGTYRGWDKNNMNQWANQHEAFKDKGLVQCFQLECSVAVRDDQALEATATAISSAITAMVSPEVFRKADHPKQDGSKAKPSAKEKEADSVLVEKHVNRLKNTYKSHHNDMLKNGKLLITDFYGDDPEKAREGKIIRGKSLAQVIKKLKNWDGDAPKRTWIYNSINLAVDEHDFEGVPSYGQLCLSHKVCLISVKDMEIKKKLIKETVEYKLSVAKLRKRIKDETEKTTEEDSKKASTSKDTKSSAADSSKLELKEKLGKVGTCDLNELAALKKEVKQTMDEYQRELE